MVHSHNAKHKSSYLFILTITTLMGFILFTNCIERQCCPLPSSCRCVRARGGQHQRLPCWVHDHRDSGGVPAGRFRLRDVVPSCRRYGQHVPQRVLQVDDPHLLQHARDWRGTGGLDADLLFHGNGCARRLRGAHCPVLEGVAKRTPALMARLCTVGADSAAPTALATSGESPPHRSHC